ncbi:patatin-like phospholipase family protein [Flagellimonas algicola]|uniref:Patatin n=1 Tax=Flagellimonas algicola TaxID=2583815 RepID=A0ABY2WRV2_9FLAO|nr:patatin-like phospholipase family protein [Allomuricauda algicola]TMU57470.1 patatin [Allomuricauda algicola]
MKKTLTEHLDPSNGTKRILSLDGGGIRGALTLGYLKKMETILRKKYDDDSLRLCDYFDLIGGTSTGSIIASGLAIGMEVDDIVTLYMDLGGKIFGKKHNWWKPWETFKYLKAEYDYSELAKSLLATFKNEVTGAPILMGGPELKTGLCIIAKRADTNSTWHIMNHPKGRFYNSEIGVNKDIPLWQAVRASSAAPTYFVPQMIEVGNGETAAFVDGGVSMANNPSLALLMVATLKGFPFQWEMGEDKLEVVSVGTGYSVFSKKTDDIEDNWILSWAKSVPDMLMQDASWQNQILMQWLSNSPTAYEIDLQTGKMEGDYVGGRPLIKYLRYNFPLTVADLQALGIEKNYTEEDVESLIEMSNAENRFELFNIGEKAAKDVLEEHFQ